MPKKKILLLSDDLRMSSGVGTMSREFVMGTIHHYDWVQLGGAIKHPEEGKVVDMNESVREETGVEDANLKIFPINGYGNEELIRQLMFHERPDAILHYTDPRFWQWLYQMEHEIRQNIPIFYYNIWDDLPYPFYNENYYESCDLIMNISRQTDNIVRNVCRNKPRTDWDCTYIPHGINEKWFHPIDKSHEDYSNLQKFRNHIFNNKDYKFVVFWNNRNIRRKLPGDVVMAFKTLCEMVGEENHKHCALIMHTSPIDDNGTDLPKLIDHLLPASIGDNIYFSHDKLDNKQMNFMVNIADVTINIASNEGFGLGTCESLMAGTPIVVNVTGGLQDQCGFKKEDGSYLTVDDYTDEFQSNHTGRYKDHGEWVKPIWPACRSLQGSPPTPYIFDDRPKFEEAGEALKYWYDMTPEKRKECGLKGMEFVKREDIGMTAEHMSNRFIKDMDTAFDKWERRKRYAMYKV
jgi:glycosyltransferase involved in cell wall biosynthesis|tara:strand:+ start:5061 stop:6449 length:1389 start_codon:yes stop_codon:yes gene_type:complete